VKITRAPVKRKVEREMLEVEIRGVEEGYKERFDNGKMCGIDSPLVERCSVRFPPPLRMNLCLSTPVKSKFFTAAMFNYRGDYQNFTNFQRKL
jgi:hypothetical protein